MIVDKEGNRYRWGISPHPYRKDLDEYVTNSDRDASVAAVSAAVKAFDEIESGSKTVTIRFDPDAPRKEITKVDKEGT